MSQSYLSNELMSSISKALLTNDKLSTLILRGNKIDSEGLKEFFTACTDNKNIQLKIVDLSSNKLNDETGVRIAGIMKHVNTLE